MTRVQGDVKVGDVWRAIQPGRDGEAITWLFRVLAEQWDRKRLRVLAAKLWHRSGRFVVMENQAHWFDAEDGWQVKDELVDEPERFRLVERVGGQRA